LFESGPGGFGAKAAKETTDGGAAGVVIVGGGFVGTSDGGEPVDACWSSYFEKDRGGGALSSIVPLPWWNLKILPLKFNYLFNKFLSLC
jgi:hypothetical protein